MLEFTLFINLSFELQSELKYYVLITSLCIIFISKDTSILIIINVI